MITFLQSVGGFLFIFGIVVLVHELGHFIAAKLMGVYAPRFSIGFGPGPRKRWGETQYQLGLIPLGGYVRMASREDESTAFLEGGSETQVAADAEKGARPRDWDPEAMIPFGPKPVPEHRWFESKPLPARLFILLAGVTMNALLTIVVLFGMNLFLGQSIVTTRVIGNVRSAPITDPVRDRLLPGDTIRSIQGVAVQNWNQVFEQLALAPGETLSIVTNRDSVTVAAGYAGGPGREQLSSAIERFVPPVLGALSPGMPAERSGLQTGDRVVAIDDRPVRSFSDLVEIVSASAGQTVAFHVDRSGASVTVEVTPEATPFDDPVSGTVLSVGRIGASPAPEDVRFEKLSVGAALSTSLSQTWRLAGTIVTTLQQLIRRRLSLDQLGGPIMIAQQSARAAQEGFGSLFYLLALLSINLAVLNLLPIPVLDGGQILIIVAEAAKGKPFSPRSRQFILGAGLALVLLLMIVVSYNDIMRLVRG